MEDSAKHVWVPDEKNLFVKASIVSEKGSVMTVRIDKTNEVREVDSQKVEKMNPAQFDQVGDMAELTYLNEPSVVHNLSDRWFSDRMYTYSGLFLVAVNPYKPLSIYDEDSMRKYKGKRREDVEPHIYAVAEQTFRSVLETGRNQSILITGESGAGKTENTKKAIQYLSSVTHIDDTRHTKGGIDERILQTNPILEAFGNAQTIRNANSSRFGKFIKINFSRNGASAATIVGASIQWYLLEKSRVVTQHRNERNYHVFYQLLAGAPDSFKRRLLIPDNAEPKSFTYLASGADSIDGVDDGLFYSRLVDAFQIMGFTTTKVEEIMTIVAAILFLGQIKFRASSADQGSVVDTADVDRAAALLGVSSSEFVQSILQPRVKVGREFSTQSRTASQAQHTVNAVAKALYERLFGYIVEALNEKLGNTSSGSCIGVLDIAGFEIFDQNSFEQLCINYTNEKLQQFFNHHMFVLEQEEYVKEKVDWDYVDYGADLQPTIDLIEKSKSPMGVFSCLNEESLLPSGSEQSFDEKLSKQWNNINPKFKPSRLGKGFAISHYAQTVDYTTDGWIEKNKDPLSDAVEQVLSESSNALVQSLFTAKDGMKVRAKSMFRTVAQRHKEQLSDLMTHLEATEPHFVRCILPNTIRSSSVFDSPLVLDQLRYNGVLEGIRIARSGFPNRLEFSEFFARYRPLAGNISGNPDSQQSCANILNKIDLDPSQYKVGLSKVFFRNGVLAELEHRLEKLVLEQTVAVQMISRGALVRRSVRNALHRRQAAKTLVNAFRINNKNASDPWWQVMAGLKPLLLSKENMDNSKKDLRMQKLETSLHRLKEEQVELISSKNELRGELIVALKEKEILANTINDLRIASKEQAEAHELAITSAKSRDEASRSALEEISQAHSKLREEFNKLKTETENSEAAWQNKLEAAIKSVTDEASSNRSALEVEVADLKYKHEAELSALSDSLSESKVLLDQTLKSHTSEITAIKSERDNLKSELETALAGKIQAEKELESVRNDACQLAESLKVIESTKDEAAKLSESLKALQLSKDEAEQSLSVVQVEKGELAQKLESFEKTHASLKTDYENLKTIMDAEYSALHEEQNKKLGALQTRMDEMIISENDLQSRYGAQEKLLDQYKITVGDKDSELQKMSAELAKVQGWLAKAKVEIKAAAETKKELLKLQKDHESTLADLENLRKSSVDGEKMAEISANANKLRKDLDIATDNLVKSDKELNSAQSEITNMKVEIAKWKSQAEKVATELGQLRTAHKALSDDNSEQKKQVSLLQRQISEKEGGLQIKQKSIEELEASLSQSKAKISELTGLLTSRPSSGSSAPVAANLDINHKLAATRLELAEAQKALLKYKTQSSSPGGTVSPYQKRFNQGDAEQELAIVRHDLAAAEARIKEHEAEIASAKQNNAQYIILRQKYEKLQREKAALAQDRSQLLLGVHHKEGQSRELEIAKAQAADVKRMKSEINVLKIQLVRSERELKEMSVKLAEATNENDVNNLKHRLRLAEIAKLQLSKTVHELSNPNAKTIRASTQIRPDEPRAIPLESGEPLDSNDPPLVVQKRGVHQALRNISNDRRVSEHAHVAAEHVKNTDLEEAVEIYKKRASQFHTKLEKAETVIQAALRAEASAKEQVEGLKMRLARIEDDHMVEITNIRKRMLELERSSGQGTILDRQLVKSSDGSASQATMKSAAGTLEDVTAERDQLMLDKVNLEKRLQNLTASMSQQPRKLQEQILALKQNEQQMMMEQSELRWKIERKERYLDTMRRNFADADAKYEQSRAEIERLQASEASREIVLRRASREVAAAKERYLMAERELDQYRSARRSAARQQDTSTVFI